MNETVLSYVLDNIKKGEELLYQRGTPIAFIGFCRTKGSVGFVYMIDVNNNGYVLGNPNKSYRPKKYSEHLFTLDEYQALANNGKLNDALRGCCGIDNFERALQNKSKQYRR